MYVCKDKDAMPKTVLNMVSSIVTLKSSFLSVTIKQTEQNHDLLLSTSHGTYARHCLLGSRYDFHFMKSNSVGIALCNMCIHTSTRCTFSWMLSALVNKANGEKKAPVSCSYTGQMQQCRSNAMRFSLFRLLSETKIHSGTRFRRHFIVVLGLSLQIIRKNLFFCSQRIHPVIKHLYLCTICHFNPLSQTVCSLLERQVPTAWQLCN